MLAGRFDKGEVRSFSEIAARKGLTLLFNEGRAEEEHELSRVDMDLVRASLENALMRARQRDMDVVAQRLERLLESGTQVEQIAFVLGSGRVYYFPEDVQRMVEAGPTIAHPFRSLPLSWLRCRPMNDGSQLCEESQRRICVIFEGEK
jgi:hypothetical protein